MSARDGHLRLERKQKDMADKVKEGKVILRCQRQKICTAEFDDHDPSAIRRCTGAGYRDPDRS